MCCAQDLASRITSPGPAGTPQAPCADARNRSPLELLEGHTRGRGGGHTFPPSVKVAPGPAERTLGRPGCGSARTAEGGPLTSPGAGWCLCAEVGSEHAQPCRGVTRPGLRVASAPSTCVSLGQAASHSLTLRTISHVNCLIYLVCSTARLGPTTPNSCGDRRGGTSRTPCCREPRARARTLHT